MKQRHKDAIRAHYYPWLLKFKKDGTVWAQQQPFRPWGRLYKADELTRHVASLKELEAP